MLNDGIPFLRKAVAEINVGHIGRGEKLSACNQLIETILSAAHQMIMDILRTDDLAVLEKEANAKVAILYAVAYLYEHREEADHKALMLSLRALLSGGRKEAF